jgi:hypothetical protein
MYEPIILELLEDRNKLKEEIKELIDYYEYVSEAQLYNFLRLLPDNLFTLNYFDLKNKKQSLMIKFPFPPEIFKIIKELNSEGFLKLIPDYCMLGPLNLDHNHNWRDRVFIGKKEDEGNIKKFRLAPVKFQHFSNFIFCTQKHYFNLDKRNRFNILGDCKNE